MPAMASADAMTSLRERGGRGERGDRLRGGGRLGTASAFSLSLSLSLCPLSSPVRIADQRTQLAAGVLHLRLRLGGALGVGQRERGRGT